MFSKRNNNENKPSRKRTIFTIFAMVNIIWYTIVVLISNFLDHQVQSELTVAWFSAWTVELALLFGIKVSSKDDTSSEEKTTSSSSEIVNTIVIDNDSNIVKTSDSTTNTVG